ncbi:TlpA disulfide reductase family protein [Octadecabacter sp. SW4]|uniref:TlpA disulfide reductase family protein n=1 Tax=Octadecabacter sp. SW4 TaxID=2602067 RepID=UPI0020C80438|nr:TlpA disulfide reductase family protein [Octadecabacter sp. SW4]
MLKVTARKMKSALLYTALAVLANAAVAQGLDIAALADLREGDMRKLNFHSEPVRGSDKEFISENGEQMTLAAFEGKYVVLNFWATWCAPCRKEMPQLSALQDAYGGDAVEVVTIATGPNPRPAMERFFNEIGVTNLPLHRDPRSDLARDMGVLGLPVTLILNPEGQEIARMQGDADWASESAMAIMAVLAGVQ